MDPFVVWPLERMGTALSLGDPLPPRFQPLFSVLPLSRALYGVCAPDIFSFNPVNRK